MKFENIYKETEENMRLALLSLWTPGHHPMRKAINNLFDREPLLAEPVFQSTFSWEHTTDDEWRDALNTEVVEQLGIGANYTPYKHQAESWKALHQGKSIVVTSGTGSGKTECFMYPVISDLCAQNTNGHTNAIEAIFLYPLNALMEDQKTRLSNYCQATGLHFAVYNGDTPEFPNSGHNEILPNEVSTREEIRDNTNQGTRPEILLTNPSMLEYILVRQKDQKMLQESAGKLRWIIIDEAHSYSGSAAVELAYQIKRILEAFDRTPEQVRFACTSATIGGKDEEISLAEFIATLTGQQIEQIKVIDGQRLVKPLDEKKLDIELRINNLPPVENVISLRNKINEVQGMTLQQIWNRLCPNKPFRETTIIPALQLIDKLCDMKQGETPVLSLRAHFFMRSICGLYACANENCTGVNPSVSLYGHLTTYKASNCPICGAPLLEIVQCKRCGEFVLMGCSDSQTKKIFPCENTIDLDDYFSLDLTDEQLEEDELNSVGNGDTFFLAPYEKDKFFNPVSDAHVGTMNILHTDATTILDVRADNDGKWVEVRKDDRHSFCPGCGKLAKGKRLNLKHFSIPINFINQTISPVFLKESAQNERSWGKYIAFTDSRQGTAISAKTFNIGIERNQSNENLLDKLAQIKNGTALDSTPEAVRAILPEETLKLLANTPISDNGISLFECAETIFNGNLFDHISSTDTSKNKIAYKAALIRGTIGRRPAYETNAETMGFIYLDYPALKTAQIPSILSDYATRNDLNIKDEDWQDFLKLAIDFVMRLNNHIQPLIDDERKYVRDSNLSSPIASFNDERKNLKHWPTVKKNKGGRVSEHQSRITLLLCAGLKIHTLEQLQANVGIVDALLKDAWNFFVEKDVFTKVTADDTKGFNNPRFFSDNKYVNCYYLDLSGREGNDVCRIMRLEKAWVCPVSNQILDTTFCGYSPLIVGNMCKKLFDKYKCSEDKISLPSRPKDNEKVVEWLDTDENVKKLKDLGLWSNRHKYSYHKTPEYIAAEHSAQQPKKILRDYTRKFSQKNPALNVLHCSTTMEMGVDIGDIDVVLMDTIPPTSANYLQRVGRAGRMGQSKAIAFSLCNNTPMGQYAFANPMWALQTTNHMIKVCPSQTIIQRHINSFFFRQFICGRGIGIQATVTVDDFLSSSCDAFVQFLDEKSTDQTEKQKFKQVFGENAQYTISITKESILKIHKEYNDVIEELTNAFIQYQTDVRRQVAISNQIRKIKSENLLRYLSEHQFIPNANMPTGVVAFDFTDKDQNEMLHRLFDKVENLKNKIIHETNPVKKFNLQKELNIVGKKVTEIRRSTTAYRDIHTALNEYAPGQTVVVNEKNFVSAGIKFLGAYNEETQTRAIYHCKYCGRTEYLKNLTKGKVCPICQRPFHSIIDSDNSSFTLAYEPVGFCTDQNTDCSREEKTEKQFYDIRPVLLNTDWSRHVDINMCEVICSGESGNILFYNVGNGFGFAFCKRCGRASAEFSPILNHTTPYSVSPGHRRLWGGDCEANDVDIARHVVFTGNHPTCYSVLRFKKDSTSAEYEKDEELAYSLGVIIKRALAKSEGIDESEIDFGIKQERNAWVLFVYDTAKGGCGYSLKLMDPVLCQEVFDMARAELEQAPCKCHEDGGACSRCLIDRSNYRNVKLLSKAKALNWLNKQKGKAVVVPPSVLEVSPDAKITYQTMKEILRQSVKDSDVKKLTLCVSDNTDDYAITDWISVRSEMGKIIKEAISIGKEIDIMVEYHPNYYSSEYDKLPFIKLNDKLPDCNVTFIKDMGEIKTAIVVETDQSVRRYFINENSALSFSNEWGKNCTNIFVDSERPHFEEQEGPSFTPVPQEIIREGLTKANSFCVKNYFTEAIAPYVLKPEDVDLLSDVLKGQHVDITFSDMYVNSALASLMLVYLIKEVRDIFGFTIDTITLQLNSHKRKCTNDKFNDYTFISFNFHCAKDADEYTDRLIQKVLGIEAEHSPEDADHHRWLRIETKDGERVEIRPDHGISGGYISNSRYMNLESLSGSVNAMRGDGDVLYYVIVKRRED